MAEELVDLQLLRPDPAAADKDVAVDFRVNLGFKAGIRRLRIKVGIKQKLQNTRSKMKL